MKITITQWLARITAWVQDERGLGLVESVVAVAILGVVVVAFALALSAGSIAAREAKQEAVAQSLARAQLEYVKCYPYNPEATTYPKVDIYDETYNPNPVTRPEGYEISSVGVASVPGTGGDTDIQKITVTISLDGEEILEVSAYKVKR